MDLSSNNPITLKMITNNKSFKRSFSVKVIQIECDSLLKAESGCLQYFTAINGKMFSFNYNDAQGTYYVITF